MAEQRLREESRKVEPPKPVVLRLAAREDLVIADSVTRRMTGV